MKRCGGHADITTEDSLGLSKAVPNTEFKVTTLSDIYQAKQFLMSLIP